MDHQILSPEVIQDVAQVDEVQSIPAEEIDATFGSECIGK